MLATGFHVGSGWRGSVTRGALDTRLATATLDAFWAVFAWLPQPPITTAASNIATMISGASFTVATRQISLASVSIT